MMNHGPKLQYSGSKAGFEQFINRMESIIRADDISKQHCPELLIRLLKGSNDWMISKNLHAIESSGLGISLKDKETTFTDITDEPTSERTFTTVGILEPTNVDENHPETIFDSSCLVHIMRLKYNGRLQFWKRTPDCDNTLPDMQYYRKVWRPCHPSNMYTHRESMEENITIRYIDPVDPEHWMQEWEVMNNTVSLGIGIPTNQQRWVNKVDRNMFTTEGEHHLRYYLWARPFVTSMLRFAMKLTNDFHRRISNLGSISKGERRNKLWTLSHTMSTKMPIHPL